MHDEDLIRPLPVRLTNSSWAHDRIVLRADIWVNPNVANTFQGAANWGWSLFKGGYGLAHWISFWAAPAQYRRNDGYGSKGN